MDFGEHKEFQGEIFSGIDIFLHNTIIIFLLKAEVVFPNLKDIHSIFIQNQNKLLLIHVLLSIENIFTSQPFQQVVFM